MNTKVNNNNIIDDLQDYMFTSKNINRYTKHIIQPSPSTLKIAAKPVFKDKINNTNNNNTNKNTNVKNKTDRMYRPKQKDSLFWCFYILKNGFFNYEMEINHKYFVVEKSEKFKYIELLRKKKDILKIHKIKPFTDIEDDLSNKDRISIKTFFALCIVENINVLLVSNRKVYEFLCNDDTPINVIHRNNETYENYIELEATKETIQKYRETYYMMSSFDATLKSMASYKVDELIDLCKKLGINLDNCKSKKGDDKKLTKKDIYEQLVLNY